MSGNIAITYSTGTDAVAQAFGDAAASLAAQVRILWVPDDEDHERRGSHPTASYDDVRWADGIAFGTPIGDGRPAGALMRFIEGMEPLWSSGWLNDKVVTVFTDRPEQIAPDSVLHPIYDVLYRWGAVIVGPRAIELALDARPGRSALEYPSLLPAARLRTAQYRAARLARLAGVLADERHRHERFAL
jgi:NAD(P)H dehydrogenase (quinone)